MAATKQELVRFVAQMRDELKQKVDTGRCIHDRTDWEAYYKWANDLCDRSRHILRGER